MYRGGQASFLTSGDTQKFVEVTSKDYNISDQLQDDTWLMVEGYDISSPKEVIIQLSYTPPLDQNTYSDTITATVTIGSVLIDPGHGGTDSGSVGPGQPTGLQEKEPNLDIGQKLNTRLTNAGVTVNMTRSGDTTVSLNQRNIAARDANPKFSFFISIHNNAVVYPGTEIPNPTVRGTETYTTNNYYSLENIFAGEIQSKVHGVVLENNRGVKRADYQVLNHSLNGYTDGNLSETTFITNATSENRLKQDDFKEAVAEAMKKAILKVLVEDIAYPKQPNP